MEEKGTPGARTRERVTLRRRSRQYHYEHYEGIYKVGFERTPRHPQGRNGGCNPFGGRPSYRNPCAYQDSSWTSALPPDTYDDTCDDSSPTSD